MSEYRTRLFVHPVTGASTEIFFADPTFEWCLLVLSSVPARLLGPTSYSAYRHALNRSLL